MTEEEKQRKLNTIYIISKGRPQCGTARTLEKEGYPGDWFIVCGNNDETLPEYQRNWGDRVLVFYWYDEITRTDTLDTFGFDDMPSGAVPVRNATRAISEGRGELRHWQLDDDYNGFYAVNHDMRTKRRLGGEELREKLLEIASFGYATSMQNVGISLGTMESVPAKAKTFARRVFNAHNLPSEERLFTRWRGRMNDDLINAIETWRNGGREMQFRHVNLTMAPTQSEDGGLSDIYRDEGTVRKSAYPVLIAPGATKLVSKFGRYHHKVNWDKLTPKTLSEQWSR